MEAAQEMRQEIWSNLPTDLLLRALSFLPFESLIRLSVLSKYWRQVVPTIKVRDNIGFVTVSPTTEMLRIYSTLKGQWVPVATLGFEAKYVASSRGILWLFKDSCLVVCNPITTCKTLNAWRDLKVPIEASIRWCLYIGMDSGADWYKIVYIDFEDLYVYDSTQDSWDAHKSFHSVIENDRFCYYGYGVKLVATFNRSILYFITYSIGDDMCTLRSYNTNTLNKTSCKMATWKHRLVRGERLTDFQLVSCMDQLMMVAYQNCPTTSEFTIGVHHFNESMKKWEQMSCAPAALVKDMNEKLFQASACESCIVVYSECEGNGVAFNVANGKWSRTPSVLWSALYIRAIASSCTQKVVD